MARVVGSCLAETPEGESVGKEPQMSLIIGLCFLLLQSPTQDIGINNSSTGQSFLVTVVLICELFGKPLL